MKIFISNTILCNTQQEGNKIHAREIRFVKL